MKMHGGRLAGLLTLIVLLLALLATTHARRINCRKFVFAPRCRGVAAKRTGGGTYREATRTDSQQQLPRTMLYALQASEKLRRQLDDMHQEGDDMRRLSRQHLLDQQRLLGSPQGLSGVLTVPSDVSKQSALRQLLHTALQVDPSTKYSPDDASLNTIRKRTSSQQDYFQELYNKLRPSSVE